MGQPALGLDAVPDYPLDTRFRNFRGALIVSRDEAVFELSDSAAVIARHIDGVRTVAAIGRHVAETFGIAEDEAVEDATALLEVLIEGGVVSVAGGAASPSAET